MAAAIFARKPRVHSKRNRCFYCASDKEIATAISRTGLGAVIAWVFRCYPIIHWQGVSCPFEEF